MSKLSRRMQSIIPNRQRDSFSVLGLRNPSDPEDFARFVTDLNTRFDAIAERLASIEPNVVDPTDYVSKDEVTRVLDDQYAESDALLTSAGAEDVGAQSSDGRTSEGRESVEEAVQALVDNVEDLGVVFGKINGSGVVELYTDVTNFYWDDTNNILHANVGDIIGAGAEATPSLYLAGDSDTGIWHPAANTLAVSTAATERLRFLDTAKVAINRTTGGTFAAETGLFVTRVVEVLASGDDANHRCTAYGGTPQWLGSCSAGTEALPTAVTSGSTLFNLRSNANYNTTPTWATALNFKVFASENWSATNRGSYATFNLTPIASTTNSELLRLVPDNAEATPAIVLSADTDTGMWHPAANTLAFSVGAAEVFRMGTGELVVNEDGDSRDFRIEGDTKYRLFHVDASQDKIGIGDGYIPNRLLTIDADIGAAEGFELHNRSTSDGRCGILLTADRTSSHSWTFGIDLTGGAAKTFEIRDVTTAGSPIRLSLTMAEMVVNDASNDYDFRVESDNAANMLFVDAGADRVGVNQATLAARLHVTESAAAAAIPVLQLDQSDVDEPFVKFLGTAAAATLTNSIVAAADVSTATVAGYLKVEVEDLGDQIADQDYYVPVYTLA